MYEFLFSGFINVWVNVSRMWLLKGVIAYGIKNSKSGSLVLKLVKLKYFENIRLSPTINV